MIRINKLLAVGVYTWSTLVVLSVLSSLSTIVQGIVIIAIIDTNIVSISLGSQKYKPKKLGDVSGDWQKYLGGMYSLQKDKRMYHKNKKKTIVTL